MNANSERIVAVFETLSDVEKRVVLSNLLRISRTIDYPDMSDGEILAAADAIFLAHDRAELND